MTKFSPIRQAIFPVAGLGSRFLPATKTVPKELLPVLNCPLIDYAVEEAFNAGIETIIMITRRGKSALEDYFDHEPELETKLAQDGNIPMLNAILRPIQQAKNIAFVRQKQAKGLGHAVGCGADFINMEEAFAVISPDDLVLHPQGCLSQMQDAYVQTGGNLLAVMNVSKDEVHQYGILATPNPDDELPMVTGLVEKPSIEQAPSTLSIIGRYILQPEIFEILKDLPAGSGGEVQLTDAIAKLIGHQPVHGFRFKGTRFDCGSVAGWLAANQAYDQARRLDMDA